jgi:CubicO group peptidase (beta-lactamase class C family)
MLRLLPLCLLALVPIPTASAEEGSVPTTELIQLLDTWHEVGVAPAIGVAVVREGEPIYTRVVGVADLATGQPASEATRFYIASTSKSLLGLTAAVLHADEKIDLDQPVTRYLPELVFRAPVKAEDITLRDLLALRHGLENGGPVVFRTAFSGEFSQEDLVRLLADYGPGEQGREFRYGNLGFNIAAMAMERATGSDWKTLVAQTVLEPAGMSSTTAWPSRVAAESLAMPHKTTPSGAERVHMGKVDATMHAAGGHVATLEDLGRWVAINLADGRIGGEQVFPVEAIATTHRQHVEQDREIGAYHRTGWGLGWDLGAYGDEALISRFGSYAGFYSHLSFMPENRLGVVVEVNDGMLGSFLADAIANSIYDLLLGKGDDAHAAVARAQAMAAGGRQQLAAELEKRAQRPQILPLPFEAYAGTYTNDAWGAMIWSLAEGRLCVAIGVARSCAEVYDGSRHQLRVELTGSGEVVTFAVEGESVTAAGYRGVDFVRQPKEALGGG